jgi:molybdopterin converting factor small subunit
MIPMNVTIKFLGTLSTKFGNAPIHVQINPTHEALHTKIDEIIGGDRATSYMLLRTGRAFQDDSEPINENDEFCVIRPISGG